MKATLGKILFLILFSVNVFANVKTTVERMAVYEGEQVRFSIQAQGEQVRFPNVQAIQGYPIQGSSNSKSTRIINGSISHSITKEFVFTPEKSVTIPSFEVNIDGKVYKSNAVHVKVVKPKQNAAGSDFIIALELNKKEAFVGESVRLDIHFKSKLSAKADKVELGQPQMPDFWVKKLEKTTQSVEGEYNVQTISYILFPQKAGELNIPAVQANIGALVRLQGNNFFNDSFFNDNIFNQVRWRKIFSNEASLKVKALPQDVSLFGKFALSAKVDKTQIRANEPVNLTLRIVGEGNVDDIEKFEPFVEEAVSYADEPSLETEFRNGVYVGAFVQKIAFVADKNFVIPSFSVRFYDKNLAKVVTKKTEPIAILVQGKQEAVITEVEKKQKVITSTPLVEKSPSSWLEKVLFVLLGLVTGVAGTVLVQRLGRKKAEYESDIGKDIKKAKGDKALFNLLLPFAKEHALIDESLKALEENLYAKASHKVDKKALIHYFNENHAKPLR